MRWWKMAGAGLLILSVAVCPWLRWGPEAAAADEKVQLEDKDFPEPKGNITTERYICYHTAGPIAMDGKMDEPSWEKAPWTSYFIDIEGDRVRPKPYLKTRVKMLWDEENLYIAAELEEPHVWGTLTQRDCVVCYDNDFEVFIDTNGDTHLYSEYEMNALNTVWDLLIPCPYRDGPGMTIDAWDIQGLKTAVHVRGTLNDPSDTDEGWSAELAFPMRVMKASWYQPPPPPKSGEQWRINFSRVEYEVKVEGGKYVKTDKPCENWTWSNQGVCNMHYPEMFGILQFSTKVVGEGTDAFVPHPDDDEANGILRKIYYRERQYQRKTGKFATNLEALGIEPRQMTYCEWPPAIQTTDSFFEARIDAKPGKAGEPRMRWHIRQDSKTWTTEIDGAGAK
jgi:hypothetical protein